VYYNWLIFKEEGWRNNRMYLRGKGTKVIYGSCVVQKGFWTVDPLFRTF
jgi:hypothetical protein